MEKEIVKIDGCFFIETNQSCHDLKEEAVFFTKTDWFLDVVLHVKA